MRGPRALLLTMSFSFPLAVLAALILGLSRSPVHAQGTVRYVAPGGACGGASPCYGSIQAAVDDAHEGDTVKVAQGVYTSTAFQVVYVTRGITITGGYTVTDWSNSYPLTRPTVLDAEDVPRRRGVFVHCTSAATVTLEGLTIQRGYAQNADGGGVYISAGRVVLRNSRVLSSTTGLSGGGVAVSGGTVVIRDSIVRGNSASVSGGGVFVSDGTVTLVGSTIEGNWAIYNGGGVYVSGGAVTLSGSTVRDNPFSYSGGGVSVSGGTVTMNGNTLEGNSALNSGGGVHVYGGAVTIGGNTIRGNSAPYGGGVWLYVYASPAMLDGNTIWDNQATYNGGGVYVRGGTVAMTGNTILSNAVTYDGSDGGGLYVYNGEVALEGNWVLSNTSCASGGGIAIRRGTVNGQNDVIARNGSTWEGVYLAGGTLVARHWTLADNGNYGLTTNGGEASLTNTVVASHAIAGLWGPDIVAGRTLFFGNGVPCDGGATCTGNLYGDPRFVDPAAGDYHIGPGSAAIDQALDVGLSTDVDGQSRPLCFGTDLGADEFMPPLPAASFTTSSPDWAGVGTVFTNTSVGTLCATYLWDFDDGTFSGAVSPTHVYTTSGVYTVVLTVTNDAGASVATSTVTVYAAGFTSSSPDWLGQTTAFVNTTVSSGITTYRWAFGDGVTSTLESPTHTYAAPGAYAVVLTATNFAGSGVVTDTVFVYGPPTAGFVAHPTGGIRPLTVTFTDTTSTVPPGDPTLTHLWDFGDGTTSDLPDPTHVYTAAGVYTVSLTVSNAAGGDVLTRTGYITVDYIPVRAGFTAWPTSGAVPLAVVFTNTSSGDYTACLWDFGDGVTSTVGSPTHTYAAVGTYTVTLTVGGPGGVDTAVGAVAVWMRRIYMPLAMRRG